MKYRRHNILLMFIALGLISCLVGSLSPGVAQTPVGTHIFNVAKATFRYGTGAGDSLHSNLTETVVQARHGAPAYVELTVSRGAITGNGRDSALVYATVRDVWGNPVPDSVVVSFAASAGSFPGGGRSVTTLTANGIASIPIRSDVVAQQFVTARIVVAVIGGSGLPISAETSVLFFPGAVQGVVINASTGQPVRGALVVALNQIHSEQGRDSTSVDGRYLIPLCQPGRYTPTITYANRFGDEVQAQFSVDLPIPEVGGIPPVSGLNLIAGNLVDRTTGMPIREAGVRLCLSQHGTPPVPAGRALPVTETTDAKGGFVFDSLDPGIYDIRVVDGKHAGTVVVHDTLSSSLAVEANVGISDRPTFEIVKTANKRIAEIGDAVSYTLEIHNTSATNALTGIRIVDELPLGFAYVQESSRHEQDHIADPKGSRTIEWVLSDTLKPGGSTRVSYMTTIGAGGMDGDGINQAYGIAHSLTGDTVQSAVASIEIVVRPGVFTDRGIVIGKVFFDTNKNGTQDRNDRGIPGVELWMEDGTHVITGNDGKYSLPEVRPGQHVIRIDRHTLPFGSKPLASGSEAAGDGISRFIRLVDGGVARADFSIFPPHQASVEMQVFPVSGMGQVRGRFVIRWDEIGNPNAIVLVDTLPDGFSYNLKSLKLNSQPLAHANEASHVLRIALPPRKKGETDTVEVNILCDPQVAGKTITVHPKVVLSYPGFGDVLFEATRSFTAPRTVPQPPSPIPQSSGAAIPGDTTRGTVVRPSSKPGRGH